MHSVEKCPLCDHESFHSFLLCEDHLSSHEQFELKQCQHCTFIFTSPRPDNPSLPLYYKSDQYISHTGQSSGLINQIYLAARTFTLRWKIQLVRHLQSANPSILDYGCGTGHFLHSCQRQKWQIAGYEPSPEARQKASSITGIKIADELQHFNGQLFDIITLWHVLEHVTDLTGTIHQLERLLKKDGTLIIAVPNNESNDAKYYKQYWAAYDVPRHLWHFTKQTMQLLLKKNGLSIQAIKPMKLDAFYVSLLSEKYIASNHLTLMPFLKGVLRGLISNQKARSSTNNSSLIYIVTK